jgi:hypothetical protein
MALKLNATSAPPETKVVSTAGMGTLVGIILQLLATYFPHLTLPSPATATLISTGLGGIVGYIAPHTVRIDDVVQEALSQFQKFQAAIKTTSPAMVSTQGVTPPMV